MAIAPDRPHGSDPARKPSYKSFGRDRSMSLRDQLEGVAESIPGWVVLLGGVGGVVIALGNLVSLSRAMAEGQSGTDLIWPVLAITFGLVLAGYFGYIALLKARRR
jgi:hypothetical protein